MKDRNINLSINKHLNEIKSLFRVIIINLQKSVTFKIQLTTPINFTSSKDNDEERVRHSKNNNIDFVILGDANEVVDKFFESFFSRYQIGLETLMREREREREILRLIQFNFCIINVTK